MGFLVYATKSKDSGTIISYQYSLDEPPSEHNSGEFTINTLTGKQTLQEKAPGDESGYGYARIQLKIKRLVDLQLKYPNSAVWES